MIRSIIIDDEPQNALMLQRELQEFCPQLEVVKVCNSAKEGLLSIKKEKPDLLFLDIEMPWMNGFEMLEMLDEINFHIIFTTAYDQFAARAFRLSAVDYLLKPVSVEDLKAAVRKVEERMQQQPGHAHIENLLRNFKQPVAQQRVALPNKDGYEFADVRTIIFCEAEGAYTRVHLQGRKPVLISRSLGDMEEMLPEEMFQRIHHSTIVNLSFVSHYIRGDGGLVKMETGEQLPVSKSRKEALMIRLGLR